MCTIGSFEKLEKLAVDQLTPNILAFSLMLFHSSPLARPALVLDGAFQRQTRAVTWS